jgi:hypothetical protein
MAYKGKYTPKNPEKYRGNPTKIVYRSLWERMFMKYCDLNPSIIMWSSEEVVVPYESPIDGKLHRYFIDFWIRVKRKDKSVSEYLIEIKPLKETMEPVKPSRRSTRYINEVRKWGVNQAKWESATKYAEKKGMQFRILTEIDLGLKKSKKKKS